MKMAFEPLALSPEFGFRHMKHTGKKGFLRQIVVFLQNTNIMVAMGKNPTSQKWERTRPLVRTPQPGMFYDTHIRTKKEHIATHALRRDALFCGCRMAKRRMATDHSLQPTVLGHESLHLLL